MLKVGTTSLVLGRRGPGLTRDLAIEKPIPTLHAVSHDPTLKTLVRLRDGTRLTAVQVQWAYLEQAQAYVDARGDDDAENGPARCSSAGPPCSPGSSATRWSVRASRTG